MTTREWPLVGRDATFASLVALIDSGGSVLLTGVAGVGKTRLATEVLAHFAALGRDIERVTASPAAVAIPLAPLAHIIGSAAGSAAVAAMGARISRSGQPLLLLVDDLHHLDDASATVIHQAVLSNDVSLVATIRRGSTLPAAGERIRHDPGVHSVEVTELDDAAVVDMVETALSGPLDRRSRNVLVQTAGGNPLFARELVEASVASGALTTHAGTWGFTSRLSTSPLLEEIVLARCAPLDDVELEALQLLAVGGRLPHSLLATIVGHGPLESLERQELVQVSPADDGWTVDVSHPLYRELIRARCGQLTQMRLHRLLAEAAGPPDTQPNSAAQLSCAVWHVRGGSTLPAADLVAAARHAVAAGDTALGSELAQVAFRAEHDVGAALLAAWCLAEGGDHERSVDLMREARAGIGPGWESAALRLRIAEEFWWTARPDDARRELADGIDGDVRNEWDDLIDAQRGVFAALDGRIDEAISIAEPHATHPHLWVRFVAAVALGNSYAQADRCDDTFLVSGRLIEDAATADVELLGDVNVHLVAQLVALSHRGDIELASALCSQAYEAAAAQPSIQARGWAALLGGQVGAIVGTPRLVSLRLAEAEQLWARCGIEGLAAWSAAGLVRSQVELGEVAAALETLDRCSRYDMTGFDLYRPLVVLADAWAAIGVGDRARAVDSAQAAVEHARRIGQITNLAAVWHDIARLDLLDHVGGIDAWSRPTAPLGALRHDFVHARRLDDGAAMADAADRFAAMGAHLYAAEAYSVAAQLARRASAPRDATRFTALAGSEAGSCEGASTPLLSSRQATGPLSRREVEIAEMAASGLTNRQIAQRLIVSERTVENHLYRTFIKLDVTSRDELGAAMQRQLSR